VDFFSNISHEFRTPLTLLLGPLEEMLASRQTLPRELAPALEMAIRNARGLLGLVNDLLDFSQADSHRARAQFEPTDLGALTTDIASAFRGAVEAAGLTLEVRCDPGISRFAMDRRMWEKIVSNLLSNALKFTFEGKILVSLRPLSLHAELIVQDTGVGIPDAEIPRLFKRFHRVRGVRARTAEGSGIGLWMVDDLVQRMGGQIRVRSKENAGTTFTIWVPFKSQRGSETATTDRPPEHAAQVARQVSRWSVDDGRDATVAGEIVEDLGGPASSPAAASSVMQRIMVVDDNADMRAYLRRLLSPHWRVDTVPDAARALELARAVRPDLILADVMMPGVDGFELLKRLRADPDLGQTAVMLVPARAGEEAAIKGLTAGADDYIAKPFSPRELIARIAASIERLRAGAAHRSQGESLARNEELERFNEVTARRARQILEGVAQPAARKAHIEGRTE